MPVATEIRYVTRVLRLPLVDADGAPVGAVSDVVIGERGGGTAGAPSVRGFIAMVQRRAAIEQRDEAVAARLTAEARSMLDDSTSGNDVQAFQQIVAGSNQQQIGFTQVMQAVRDIGQASQQSAASTGQLEKSAVHLSSLAQQLQKSVERYRV